MIIYKDILQRLKEAGYNTTVIKRDNVLSQSTLTALRNNKPLNIATINVICRLLKCQPGDILAYIDDEPAE